MLADGDNALLVPPEDPGALAAAIRRLLVNPGLADRLRRTAYEQVRNYTWDARAVQILEALGRMEAAPPRTSVPVNLPASPPADTPASPALDDGAD